MKKVMLLAAGLFFAFSSFAQQADNKQPVKKIEVNGTAEMEITPDEIYISISLKEYLKGKTKTEISTLEKQLQKAVQDAGIAKENLTIENVYGNNYDYWVKKKNPLEFMARKQYRLKLNKLDKINDILGAVDAEGIENTRVSSYTSSKMEEYRKEVKIKALQAAKNKADYMLNAIGSKIGDVIEIQEISTDNYSDVRPEYSNVMMYKAGVAADNGGEVSSIEFKTIKIRAEVRTVFGIR
ncbi:SIMPL domain-containing protein [Chitinophaga nivalis]|uniref:SIMPL domain-containing protein n=1 Tax=Chitinophaga nivalis TaxID=2991709 RepID=A0ABT3IU99_9BACT|nr:SIMPL domain-containing protein [Chitinophaga nivalis]MCW3462767.1 SIMPL domain-containing protein [Chitinophaga nivalis]MCW3487543.1 SIMPL domain-containing protein [Chitinophaga nivalis]